MRHGYSRCARVIINMGDPVIQKDDFVKILMADQEQFEGCFGRIVEVSPGPQKTYQVYLSEFDTTVTAFSVGKRSKLAELL
jgi:hypothetical protein